MTDREKVIKELKHCIGDDCNGDKWSECEYSGHGCIDALLKDTIALLKAQEPIEARLHLCESCTKEFPECEATVDDIEFGCGVGNDNIIGCTAYENRWKAQEPVEPMHLHDESKLPLKCGNCGAFIIVINKPFGIDSYRAKFCCECGKAVKWK